MTRLRRTALIAAGVTVCIGLASFLAPTGYAAAQSSGRISTVADIAAKPVAIVFGAAVYSNGQPTDYLKARLDLAEALYAAGKVKVILVSGDNRHRSYNEPDAMRSYLIEKGVPRAKVVADYAGFDTYASCVRARRIFGVEQAILVSQSYHLARAITTCRAVGVDAWGVGDSTVSNNQTEWQKDSLREWPANVKMVWDLVSGRRPVLGRTETSVTEALKS